MRGAAILRADLDHLIGFFRGVHNVEALFDGVGQRFFGVDMLAGFDGGDGHVVVQMLGRHDEHGIDGLVGQQVVVVLVSLGSGAPDRLHAVVGASDVPFVGVADRRDLDIVRSGRMHPIQGCISAGADANPTNVDLFIGGAARDNGRTCGDGSGLQKIATIEFVGHGDLLIFDCASIISKGPIAVSEKLPVRHPPGPS